MISESCRALNEIVLFDRGLDKDWGWAVGYKPHYAQAHLTSGMEFTSNREGFHPSHAALQVQPFK
jgi:hypothetical protein